MMFLEIAPESKRATYMGFVCAVMVPVCFAPLLGSFIIGGAERYTLGFLLATVMGLGGLVNNLKMGEIRWDNGEREAASDSADSEADAAGGGGD